MNHVFLTTPSKEVGSLRLCNPHFSVKHLYFGLHCAMSVEPPYLHWSVLSVALSQDVNLHSLHPTASNYSFLRLWGCSSSLLNGRVERSSSGF